MEKIVRHGLFQDDYNYETLIKEQAKNNVSMTPTNKIKTKTKTKIKPKVRHNS